MSFLTLRKFIREEIGRSFQTINPDPYTFADLPGYNVEIDGGRDGKFFLTVEYEGKPIGPTNVYLSHEDAKHASRMIIDRDRVKRMNS